MNEIEKRFRNIPEVEPDERDLKAMERIKKANDNGKGITLEEMDRIRAAQEYSGKISLRVPKTLHRDLTKAAKQEGISLNQFILYKLVR
ncbi:MAG: type II toxin-antitoxin system HicB family antitoxin [Oscillospiraceae bacterium]|nr:type II toxin-antitoxin system HicB family antitoxin [Oscillospiraceae bacterium]